jgi:hypothetical protein
VAGGLVNLLGYRPATDVCSRGGELTHHAADFRTGTAPPQPVFLNRAGYDPDSGTIRTGRDLGSGMPPLGRGLSARPGARSGEMGQIAPATTGEAGTASQQSDARRSGILFRRER